MRLDPILTSSTMRRSPSVSLLSIFALLSSLPQHAIAGPYPRNAAHDYAGAGFLMPRQCVQYCGMGDQYCCTQGQVCYTDAQNIAICGPQTALAAVGGNGVGEPGWAYYTVTYVETVDAELTRTSTLSSFIGNLAAPVTPTQDWIPQSTAICFLPNKPCGSICCASNQYCYTNGQCKMVGEGSLTIASSYLTAAPVPTSFSAPVRGTSITTETLPVTTTQPFVAPVATGSTGLLPPPVKAVDGGLSPGAIAGIVIGVIAGIILLILILLCVCGAAALKGIFGLFKKKDDRGHRREEIIEERRTSTRYGGAAAAASRDRHSGWFGGGGPTRVTRTEVTEKKTRVGEGTALAGLGLGLGALWAGLKYKRHRDGQRVPSTRYTGGSRRTSRRSGSRYTGTTDSTLSSSDYTRRTRSTRR